MPPKHRGKRTSRPAGFATIHEDDEPKVYGKGLVHRAKHLMQLSAVPYPDWSDVKFILGTISVATAVYLLVLNWSTLMEMPWRPKPTLVKLDAICVLIDRLID